MGNEKKTKLKKLQVSSVDMVPRGANQDAEIALFKGWDGEGEAHDEMSRTQRFMNAIAKVFSSPGAEESLDDETLDEIEKEAKSFSTFGQQRARRRINDESWDYTAALRDSFESILNDNDLSQDEQCAKMIQSVNEFVDAMESVIPRWAAGETTIAKGLDEETDILKQAEMAALQERLEDLQKACGGGRKKEIEKEGYDPEDDEEEYTDPDDDSEEEYDEENLTPRQLRELENQRERSNEDMAKIDKSLLTPEEQAQLDSLVAKAAVQEQQEVNKGVDTPEQVELKKALNEVAELKKSLQMKEYEAVAKKYEILGKQPEEVAKTLYAMHEQGEEIYKAYVGALDDSLALVEKSGVFAEIGKSTRGAYRGNNVVNEVEKAATEIMKADPNLSREEAIVKAWDNNPELLTQYEQERMM